MYPKFTNEKILVLGGCQLNDKVIQKVAKEYGLRKNDFEFVPYKEITNFDFHKLLNSGRYSDIFIGPVPHSAKKLDGYISPLHFFAANADILPFVQELRQMNGQLGISKTNFEQALLNSVKFSTDTCEAYAMGLLA